MRLCVKHINDEMSLEASNYNVKRAESLDFTGFSAISMLQMTRDTKKRLPNFRDKFSNLGTQTQYIVV